MTGKARVNRRHVFYVPGFDPFPPRRYRELYRSEAAAQAAISGHRIEVRRSDSLPHGWKVDACVEGVEVVAEFEVLVWSDLVREAMGAGVADTYVNLLRAGWTYASTGALWRLVRLRRGATLATFYPVAVLTAGLVVAVLIGWAGWHLVARLAGHAGLSGPGSWTLSLLGGAVAAYATLALLLWTDRRHYAVYLLQDYAHAASAKGGWPTGLGERIGTFRDRVLKAFDGDCDEILIVGHSSGAHIAVAVLAAALRSAPPPPGKAVGLLTLGQAIPMMSFLPAAADLRRDLRFLSERDDIAWIDVSAPGDGCSYALCDPVAVSGVAGEAKRWPLVLSAAFSESLSEARRRELRWRFFRLHFQYLCAFDRPRGYDYFAITAGPQTLRQRFEGRSPSPQRVETPLNRYRTVA